MHRASVPPLAADERISNGVVLVTGAAGFIGYHLCTKLLVEGFHVIGLDNLNEYYDVRLKLARLEKLRNALFTFYKLDITDAKALDTIFAMHHIEVVVHLAAHVGARHSVTNPREYIENNILGSFNVLDACRQHTVKHFLFASSSSVYGVNSPPFSIQQSTDTPLSPYAVTKKTSELMAYNYSYLYNLPCDGLRLFTVYGPWGRPDMAYFSFTKAILESRPIDVYNSGKMSRDFTDVDDVIESIFRLMNRRRLRQMDSAQISMSSFALYNIGNDSPVPLIQLISTIEDAVGKKARINYRPAQAGDVIGTHADTQELESDIGYKPMTSLENGISRFVKWYRQYYEI
jgi:UDP-glucuronate 4-epimerase